MKERMVTCLLAGALAFGLAACAREEAEPMDDRATMAKDEDLSEFRERLISAYSSADARGLAQLFTEDAVMIPSAGKEIKGRQAIERTYSEIWKNSRVAQFNLTPLEGKVADNWAFERGTITVQVIPTQSLTGGARQGATQGQPQAQGGAAQGQQQGGQPGGGGQTPPAGPAGGAPTDADASGGQVVMDTSYYVLVMQKVADDWRISWFISTNPPEYEATVTANAGGDRTTRQQAPAGSQRPAQPTR